MPCIRSQSHVYRVFSPAEPVGRFTGLILLCAIAALILPQPVGAVVIGGANQVASAKCEYNLDTSRDKTLTGSYGTAQCTDIYGNPSRATVNGLFVSAYAEGAIGNFPTDQAFNDATASLTYYWAVLGPPDLIGTPVNIDVSSFLTAMVPEYSGVSFATSSVTVFDQFHTTSCTISAGSPTGDPYSGGIHGPAEFHVCNFNAHDTVDVGYQNMIEISATAESHRSEFASALADPYVQIDPSTPNAGLYDLVFSDGIINAPAPVPEPDALGLMLGFCGIWAIVRRRRKSSALAG